MINHKEHAQLVAEAQLGDKESLNRLAEVARVYLHEYVLRLTLQKDLTQDIVQESILEMFKVFHKLKNTEKFWSWLDGIAFNKIRSHYGRKWRHKTISLSEIGSEIATEESQSALADTINRELKQIVVMSMRELAPRHRAVLTMRCYKGMPYSEIATVLGCTEFGAQSLFYRAKKSLAKKLATHGLGKGCLLTALVVFGKLTAATEATAANITVTAATLKVSTAAALLGVVTSKTAVVSLLTAGAITAGAVAVNNETVKINGGPQNANAGISVNATQEIDAVRAAEQLWYFFPEVAGSPVMMRLLKFDESGQISHCQYLQNQHSNYYYDNGVVYIKNSRFYNPDLFVERLPTDDEDLSRFISHVENRRYDVEYISSKRKGLLVIAGNLSNNSDNIRMIDSHTNVLEEEYFQFDWPLSTKVVDMRDTMHKRGWTYFKIDGWMDGKKISGTGRIPFVYEAGKGNNPWLQMKVVGGVRIEDTGTIARIIDRNGKTLAAYESGSFFKGLPRPWMGLHSIDTIRRDAAQEKLQFDTTLLRGNEKAEVILTDEQIRLVYIIDLENDVVEKISFSTDDGDGELNFSYLQDIDDIGNEFTQPKNVRYRGAQENSGGILWLKKLINSRW